MKLYIIIFSSFVLPWAVGIVFFLKDKKIFVTIAPFSIMLAYIFNTIGIDLGLFYPMPVKYLEAHTLAIFPNVGLLTVLSCIFIYLVAHIKIKPIILNIIITVIATSIDSIFIAAGFLEYNRGWNYLHSIVMYFISFSIIYLYYLWLKKLVVL